MNLELNGAIFNATATGNALDGVIILLHGGRGIGSHASEIKAYAPLADRYLLVGFDQRGCGKTSRTPPYTFAQLADDVEAVRLHYTDKPIILIGGSFGGMIALTYVLRYPGSVSHLVLRGTAPSHHHEQDALKQLKARLHKAPMMSEAILERLFRGEVKDDIERRLMSYAMQPLYASEAEPYDPEAGLEKARLQDVNVDAHNALFIDGRTYDVRDRLGEIACPTLILCGAEDWICPPVNSTLMADRIPGAELMMVEGANHAVHIEANDRVIPRIRSFLSTR